MHGSYDLTLVFASYCVAVIASYTALYFGTRLFSMEGAARKFWLAAGALCMGSGIWSMHFVGMSAYSMPMHMTMSFSLSATLASWVPAVAASLIALYVIAQKEMGLGRLIISSLAMGAGICAMHYGGMAAMGMTPAIRYDNFWFSISVVIAVVASGAALIICRQVRHVSERYATRIKTLAALVMGVAICGMHYTGMHAAIYSVDASLPATNLLRGDWMGIPTAIATIFMLLATSWVAWEDSRRIEQQQQTQLQRQSWIDRASITDLVTGFSNRQYFDQQLLKRIAQPDAAGFTIISVELTGYRHLLTSQGEETADALMRLAAKILKRNLFTGILFSRYNRSRFVIMSQRLDTMDMKMLASSLADAMTQQSFTSTHGDWSMGYSHFPSTASNSRQLLLQAQQEKFGSHNKGLIITA